jgi:hypothetical protein
MRRKKIRTEAVREWSRRRDCYRRAIAVWLRGGLVELLGGRCALCGCTEIKLLEIDHEDGIGWSHNKLDSYRRARRYWREFFAGIKLRVLCRRCNAAYRPSKRQAKEDEAYERFHEIHDNLYDGPKGETNDEALNDGASNDDESPPDNSTEEPIPF